MPEEEVQYNVRLNEAELSEQLERIRSQIDLTMGSIASSNSELPLASDLINPQSALQSANLPVGLPDDQPIPIGMQQDQGMWGGITAAFDDAAQSAQLGVSKFTNDMRRIGLLSKPQYPDFGMQRSGLPQQGPMGFWDNAAAIFAPAFSSYDPNRGGMTSSEFRNEAVDNFSNSFTSSLANNSGALSGIAIGSAVGGVPGALTGLTIGGTADLAGDFLASYEKERMKMSNGLKRIAGDNFGSISSGDASKMARVMQDQVYSLEGRIKGYDMESLQENVVGFAEAGGFSNDTSAAEMQETLQGVVENARRFANEMNMAQEDAVQVMADLKRNMVSRTSEMGNLGAEIGRQADQFGMDPGELLGFGTRGMEIYRGTGATNSQGFNMAIEARLQTERMRRADPTTRQLINQAGGVEQFAIGQAESAARFMQSGQGMLATTAVLGGMESGPGSISGMLNSSAQFLTDKPGNIFRFFANQGRLNASMGFENQQNLQVMTAYQMADQSGFTGPNGQIDDELFVGLMQQFQNMTSQEARSALAGFRENARTPAGVQEAGKQMNNMQSLIESNDTSLWARATGGLSKAFSLPDSRVANGIFRGISEGISDAGESIGDFMSGQGRYEGLGISRERAQNALNITSSQAYKDAVSEVEGYSQEERDAIIREDLEDRFGDTRYGLTGQLDRVASNRNIDKSILEKTIYGLGEEGAREFMSNISQNKYTREDLQGLSMMSGISGSTEIQQADRVAANSITDSALTEGTLPSILNNSISQMTEGSVTDFSEASESQRAAVLNRVRAEGGITGDVGRMLDKMRYSENTSKSRMVAGAMNREARDLEGLAETRINNELIPGLGIDSAAGELSKEDQTAMVKDIIEHPGLNLAAKYGGEEFGKEEYANIRSTLQGSESFAEVKKQLQNAQALRDRSRATTDAMRTFSDQIDNKTYLEFLSSDQAIRSRAEEFLNAPKDDVTYTIMDNYSNSTLEELAKGSDAAMRKVRSHMNEDFEKKIGDINSKILKKSFLESTGGDPSKMFKNMDEYVQKQVFNKLHSIIEPGGIKTIKGSAEDTQKAVEDRDDRPWYQF